MQFALAITNCQLSRWIKKADCQIGWPLIRKVIYHRLNKKKKERKLGDLRLIILLMSAFLKIKFRPCDQNNV